MKHISENLITEILKKKTSSVKVKKKTRDVITDLEITMQPDQAELNATDFSSIRGGQDENDPVEVILHSSDKFLEKTDEDIKEAIVDSDLRIGSGPREQDVEDVKINRKNKKITYTLFWHND